MSVYDKDAFQERVDYAAYCMMRGIVSSRTLDTCFEMNDGEAVVTALVRRARKNPKLWAAIANQWSGEFPQSWLDKASKYDALPRRDLPIVARRLREEGR